MRPTELLAVQRVRTCRAWLGLPLERSENARVLAGSASSLVPSRLGRPQMFVSTIEGEICGYLLAQRDDRRYRWNLVAAGAGSARLEATDAACIELWSALAEYVTTRAGQVGARRLFARVVEGGVAHASLCEATFVPYCRMLALAGRWRDPGLAVPSGFRAQHDSDTWSIHQLYHRATPRPVQFAEALTSDEWNVPRRRDHLPLIGDGYREQSYVLEAVDSVIAFARVRRRRGGAQVSLMVQPERDVPVDAFIAAALRSAGVGRRCEVIVAVPDYLRECVDPLERLGLAVQEERLLMFKHTTAAAIVHPKLVPLPSLRRRERRAARRAPSLMCGQVATSRTQL